MGSNLLHVDLDGIPAQQVLDLDLLDTAALSAAVPVVGHVRSQEDLDLLLQEPVGDVGFLQGVGLQRGYDESVHPVAPDVVHEGVVIGIDIHAHEHLPHHVGAVGDKTHDVELVLRLRPEGLGDVHTGLGSVDVGPVVGGFRLVEIVVQGLDGHTGDDHDRKADHVGDHQHRSGSNAGLERQRPQPGHGGRREIGQCQCDKNMHHIHEGGVAEDIGISPEYAEENQVQQQNHGRGDPDFGAHLHRIIDGKADGVGQDHGKNNDAGIEQQDGPGRKDPGRENASEEGRLFHKVLGLCNYKSSTPRPVFTVSKE